MFRAILNFYFSVGIFGLLLISEPLIAQVTNISPSGLGTTVAPPRIASGQVVYDITGGTRKGTSLFHSFGAFNVGNDNTANFLNDDGPVNNILSRVTGGSASNIFGQIKTTDFGAANLFLINPSGIVFGPNASIDVSGSFHASTADFVRLVDGIKFNAVPGPEDAFLTSAPVAVFGFLSADPASIQITKSTIEVQSEKTLSLVGGNITIESGVLRAKSGEINITSVDSSGEIGLDPGTSMRSVNLDEFGNLGKILIRGGTLDVTGTNVEDSGSIYFNGGDTTINQSQVLASTNSNNTNGGADGGDINFNVERLSLLNLSKIDTSANLFGVAGNIRITATKDIKITGSSSSGLNTIGQERTRVVSITNRGTTNGGENSGAIEITSPSLAVSDGAQIQATSNSTTKGQAGKIDLNVGKLALTDGGQITNLVSADGIGSTVKVRAIDGVGASNLISIRGQRTSDPNSNLDPRSGIFSETQGTQRAGDIDIKSEVIEIRDGGTISAESSGIATGDGGNIVIDAADVLLSNGGSISAESFNQNADAGKSGSIVIHASDALRIFNDSQINVETQRASAGDITLNVGNLLHLKNQGAITTSANDGDGNGGNINIDPVFVILEGGSSITAQAAEGSGGNINIVANSLFLSPDSEINASSTGGGIDGTVEIDSPTTDILGGTLQLPENFASANALLSERCGARVSKGSSFVLGGTGGLPPGPDTMISASLAEIKWVSDPSDSTAGAVKSDPANYDIASLVSDPITIGCATN